MKALKYDPLNLVVCGIGGQGNILASDLLGSALVEKGYQVAVGETYGASQRGGSVMSHIRVSETLELGVLIPQGQANLILGFEPLEALRMLYAYGNEKTAVICDPRPVYPLGVLVGEQSYPDLAELEKELAAKSSALYQIPAAELALEAGNAKAANIALIGALSAAGFLPLDEEDFEKALEQRFSGPALELNKKVFAMGRDALLAQLARKEGTK